MTDLLHDKIAIVTGGVTGIGRAIALEYLKHGAKVAINHYPDPRSASQFEEMRREAGHKSDDLMAVPGDVALPETGTRLVKETVNRFGRLDIFVNNAGVCQFEDFLKCVGLESGTRRLR